MFSSIVEWAHYSPQIDFWTVVSLLTLGAVTSFIYAFDFFSRKRLIEDTPTSKTRSAAQGYIELIGKGKLMDGPPIIAPLSGKQCVWYRYKITEKRGSGKNSSTVTIAEGVSEELFLLVDDTGSCIIDPDGAKVTCRTSDHWHGYTAWPSSLNTAYTNKGGRGYGPIPNFTYWEERLQLNDQLYAIGLYNTVGGTGGDFGLDDDVRDLVREWKRDSEMLLKKYDKNNDGQLDMREWETMRRDALQTVLTRHDRLKDAPPANVMSKTCDSRCPYILSAVPQNRLVRRLYHYSLGLLFLFFVCGTIVTWLIGLRLSNV